MSYLGDDALTLLRLWVLRAQSVAAQFKSSFKYPVLFFPTWLRELTNITERKGDK